MSRLNRIMLELILQADVSKWGSYPTLCTKSSFSLFC